jgi:CubicO group peptidase (beta-lactamase class C family)
MASVRPRKSRLRRALTLTLFSILFALVAFAVSYAWRAFPIISGYGAKNLCSCTMLAGRDAQEVINQELNKFPINLGGFTVSYEDSSATGTVFGLARRKAIYRKGLGCSLVAGTDEAEVRAQRINLAPAPLADQDTVDWPTGNRGAYDTLNPAVDYNALRTVLDSAFAEPGPKKTRHTRTIVVVYNGKIIAERYAEGFDRNTLQLGWSMTKSLTNAMVGALVKQGKLDINAPAPIAAWRNDNRSRITLNDLMHQSSGLQWEENYGGPSGATNMLFKVRDMGLYAAEYPAQDEPGKVFYYSSGTSNIIARIIRETVGDERYYRFAYDSIFYPIGMYHTVVEPDAGGTYVGSSYSYANAYDWARFGLLYLNDGVWNGRRILPEGWVKYSSTPAPAAKQGQYGAQFWLNAGAPGTPEHRQYPNVPADLYWADGFEGQNVFILPSKNLVVVKLSLSQNGEYLDDDKFLHDLIQCLH